MEAQFGLLVMLFAVSNGVETSCDARQNGAQCYGALGGTVEIRLMDKVTEMDMFIWRKDILTILRGREMKVVPIPNVYRNRSTFIFNNGTFRISNLNRDDSGKYELQLLNSNGTSKEKRTQSLSIQAPVSWVHLHSECLSQGDRRVSCSSGGGDSPQYSWTLDGHTLKDFHLLYENKTFSSINVSQDVSGQLVCSVSNHVSNVSEGEKIPTCVFINCTSVNGTQISQWLPEEMKSLCFEPTTPPGTTVGKESDSTNPSNTTTTFKPPEEIKPWYINYLPVLGGVLSVLIIALLVGVVCICSQKSKHKKNPKDDQDDQELTYADVRIVRNQGRQIPRRTEMEVEYGEVKVSGRPRQTFETPNDDCVYAKVRKAR